MIRSFTLAIVLIDALTFSQAYSFESNTEHRLIKSGGLIEININHPDNFNFIVGVFLPNPDNSESMGNWSEDGGIPFVIKLVARSEAKKRALIHALMPKELG